jgi:hypothetical protein
MIRTVLLSVACTLVVGCSGPRGPFVNPLLSTGGTNTAGAHQIFLEEAFEQVDLLTLLDPDDKRATLGGSQARAFTSASTAAATKPTVPANTELERAFQAFYTYGDGLSLQDRRSRVQDRIMAASEQRCTTYKLYLKRVETGQSTTTGILATVLGGAGAIATNVSAARGLAGLAGISSGIGAELKQGYFSNMASHVITPGIDLARAELRRDMLSKRTTSLSVYTVEAALIDTARYHAACSINSGLERAGQAVREVHNPGLRSLNLTLGQLGLAQKLARRLSDDAVDVTEKDLRLADGGFPASTTATGAQSPLEGRPGYVDRLLAGIQDRTNALNAAKSAVTQKATELQTKLEAASVSTPAMASTAGCAAVADKALQDECIFRLKLLDVLAKAASTGTAHTVQTVLVRLNGLPKTAYLAVLATRDAAAREKQFALLKTASGSVDEVKARQAMRDHHNDSEQKFGAAELQFALVDQAIAQLRHALLAKSATDLDAALKALDDAAGKLEALS